jgi:hypothetical protein
LEKKLIKGALYGFVIGLFIAILYYPDVKKYVEMNGATIIHVPMREYIFQVLRFSIRASLAAIAAVGLMEVFKIRKSNSAEFLKEIIKSFVIAFVIIMIILWILGMVLE